MPGILRSLLNYIVEIFWIYLRFMVLAVIIFFLVQWYIRKYEEETLAPSTPTATTTPASQLHSSAKQDL